MSEATHWGDELVRIMACLRAEDGCPWDREQDHQSLKKYLVEEVYELIDAIDDGDDDELRDELGDLLLQIVFHCQIAAEEGRFDFQDVGRTICRKMIRRHPHVFGGATVDDSGAVLRQWEEIKREEAGSRDRVSALDGIPRQLPALSQAEKIQKKAAKLGFDWPDVDGVVAKIEEELEELKEAVHEGREAAVHEEIGDVLFSVVNLSRYLHLSAEDILRGTVKKFYDRFRYIEQAVEASGRPFEAYTLEELDSLWNEAKRRLPE